MPKPCRILKDFSWHPTRFRGVKDAIVSPPAQLRSMWLKKGLIEVIGEEAYAAKMAEAEKTGVPLEIVKAPKGSRGKAKKSVATA